jgi:hypothetical protein
MRNMYSLYELACKAMSKKITDGEKKLRELRNELPDEICNDIEEWCYEESASEDDLGIVERIKYKVKGVLHREDDEPAKITTYYDCNGDFASEIREWYQNGERYRAQDQPCLIDTDSKGRVRRVDWTDSTDLHPHALCKNQGEIIAMWMKDDRLHSFDGMPSLVVYRSLEYRYYIREIRWHLREKSVYSASVTFDIDGTIDDDETTITDEFSEMYDIDHIMKFYHEHHDRYMWYKRYL